MQEPPQERVLLIGSNIARLLELRGTLDDCPAQIVITPSLESAKDLLLRYPFAAVAIDIEALGDADSMVDALGKEGFPQDVTVFYVVDGDDKTASSPSESADFVTRKSARERIMRRLSRAGPIPLRDSRKTECGGSGSRTGSPVRGTPFAAPKTEPTLVTTDAPVQPVESPGLPSREVALGASGVLREPLLSLGKAAGMLRRLGDKLDSHEREMLDGVIDIVEHTSHLLDSMTRFILTAVADAPLLSVVDFNAILRDVADRLKGEFEATSGQVSWAPLPTLLTDKKAIDRVFSNLIGNALKYRSEAPLVVHVDAHFDGGQWTFSVTDNGAGVDPEHSESIFRPFWWDSCGAPPRAGLGLALNRLELEILGGRIWVEGREGGGSVFRLTLPAASDGLEHLVHGNGARRGA